MDRRPVQKSPDFKLQTLFFTFIVVFALKFFTLFYLSGLAKCQDNSTGGKLSIFAGDAFSYIGAMENYITKGTYFFFNGTREVYAGRMPYYGALYFVIRTFASPVMASDWLAFFQIIIECISIIFLGLISIRFFHSKFTFWFTIVIATISLNISYWSLYLLPESLSVSLLIFFIYYYLKYKDTNHAKHFWHYVTFLSLLILLKPYYCLIVGFVFFDILTNNYSFKKLNLFDALKQSIAVIAMVFLFLTPWIIRNYMLLKKFIPLQESTTAGYHYTEADFSCRRFIESWGGSSSMFWDKRSAASYFFPAKDIASEFTFPDYVFTNQYGFKEVENLRNKYVRLQANYSDSLNNVVTNEFNKFRNQFIKEHTCRFYFVSPLLIVQKFLFHSGSYYLPINASFKCYQPYQLVIKLLQSFLYYFTLFFGFIGLILLVIKHQSAAILITIPLLIILLFCFYLKTSEFRFFIHSYPVLILGSAYISEKIKTLIIGKYEILHTC